MNLLGALEGLLFVVGDEGITLGQTTPRSLKNEWGFLSYHSFISQ